jgi:ribosomal protein S18 acetylase RimI-like enzyme
MTAPASHSPGLAIRPVRPADREALFDICLKTADSGADGTELFSDPKLPGYVWAVPYAVLEPDFAFVLARDDRPIGYVVAAPDTAAFERRLEAEWWPEIRRIVAGYLPRRPLDANALAHINTPEADDPARLEAYPAHLHINVLPEAQGGGWGRRLIETELDALRRAAVRGVHLGVSPTNTRARGFYAHVGFTDVSRGDEVVFAMKL